MGFSGDGRETPAREVVLLMPAARAMARARGVTVNGLAILNEDAGLANWYANNVISGPGSFVIPVADFEAFSEAIVRKLVREIEWQERLTESGPVQRIGEIAPAEPSWEVRANSRRKKKRRGLAIPARAVPTSSVADQ